MKPLIHSDANPRDDFTVETGYSYTPPITKEYLQSFGEEAHWSISARTKRAYEANWFVRMFTFQNPAHASWVFINRNGEHNGKIINEAHGFPFNLETGEPRITSLDDNYTLRSVFDVKNTGVFFEGYDEHTNPIHTGNTDWFAVKLANIGLQMRANNKGRHSYQAYTAGRQTLNSNAFFRSGGEAMNLPIPSFLKGKWWDQRFDGRAWRILGRDHRLGGIKRWAPGIISGKLNQVASAPRLVPEGTTLDQMDAVLNDIEPGLTFDGLMRSLTMPEVVKDVLQTSEPQMIHVGPSRSTRPGMQEVAAAA